MRTDATDSAAQSSGKKRPRALVDAAGSGTMAACSRASCWTQGLQCLWELLCEGWEPEELPACYSAIIAASAKLHAWERSLLLCSEALPRGDPLLEHGNGRDDSDSATTAGRNELIVLYAAAVHACERGLQWQVALDLIEDMKSRTLTPSLATISAAIAACAAQGKRQHGKRQEEEEDARPGEVELWQRALQLFGSLEEKQLQPHLVAFNAALNACSSWEQWQAALALLQRSDQLLLQPDAMSFNAIAVAFKQAGEWRFSQWLLEEMQRSAVEADVLTYGATLEASTAGSHVGQPELADLLESLSSKAISCCEASAQ